MNAARLVIHQCRYDQKQFWREPAAVFFTIALPVIFLLLFASIFGTGTTRIRGHDIESSTYYVPGILTLALVAATTVNLAVGVTNERERGHLKRVRATPAPAWVVLGGKALTAFIVAVLMAVVVTGIGRVLYGVEVPGSTLLGLLLTLVVAVPALAVMGFALTAAIPSENAAPPVTNAVVLPLYFISGVFIPSDQIPDWMLSIADAFPVKPLFDALLTAFDPLTTGAGIELGDLAVVAAWGVAGAVAAARLFRWSPRT
jgi:ABC-2 type transport system permease protein